MYNNMAFEKVNAGARKTRNISVFFFAKINFDAILSANLQLSVEKGAMDEKTAEYFLQLSPEE